LMMTPILWCSMRHLTTTKNEMLFVLPSLTTRIDTGCGVCHVWGRQGYGRTGYLTLTTCLCTGRIHDHCTYLSSFFPPPGFHWALLSISPSINSNCICTPVAFNHRIAVKSKDH
jgi:hypothetical protein